MKNFYLLSHIYLNILIWKLVNIFNVCYGNILNYSSCELSLFHLLLLIQYIHNLMSFSRFYVISLCCKVFCISYNFPNPVNRIFLSRLKFLIEEQKIVKEVAKHSSFCHHFNERYITMNRGKVTCIMVFN